MLRSLLVLTLVVFPVGAPAQVCDGRVPFSRGPFQAGVNLSFNQTISSVGAGFGLGTTWAFGQVLVSHQFIAQVNKSSSTLGGRAGLQARFGPGQRRFYVCPVATWSRTSGPERYDVYGDGYPFNLSEKDYSFGLALGMVVSNQPQTQVAPLVSLARVHTTVEVVDSQTEQADTTTHTISMLGLGVGVVFNHSWSLRPGLRIPLNASNAKVSYGIAVGVNF